jgi:hypothetical protein
MIYTLTRTYIVLALLYCHSSGVQSVSNRDEVVIQYAKTLDVRRLDAALPSKRLEDWLQHGPPRVTDLEWRASDCDLKSVADAPASRRPLCVKIAFSKDDVSGWAMIRVGNVAQGVIGTPHFEYAVLMTGNLQRGGRQDTVTVLSALPESIKKLQSTPSQ